MPGFSIVGADRLPSGDLVCASTTRKMNRLSQFNGEQWTSIAEWKGKEVTACCAVGERVVCAALDGALYLWSNGQIETLALPGKEHWIYAACALPNGTALLGGSHGLIFLDPETRTLTARRLGDYGVERPGRKVHGISRTGSRVFITGAKNLLVEYLGDTAVEIGRPAFAGKELLIQGAVPFGSRLWLTSFGKVACLEGETLVEYENPAGTNRSRAVGVKLLNDEPWFFESTIVVGEPPSARPLVQGFSTDGILDVLASPITGEQCALTWTGKSYVLSSERAREVPLT